MKQIKKRATGERFAVKILKKAKMSIADKETLEREIFILRQIDHPNIVRLIDTYEDEKHFCLVLELMLGGELFDKILATAQFSEHDARNCTVALIDAIRYCHGLGIVHRDIKPENLLLLSDELGLSYLKVGDFGLAR